MSSIFRQGGLGALLATFTADSTRVWALPSGFVPQQHSKLLPGLGCEQIRWWALALTHT